MTLVERLGTYLGGFKCIGERSPGCLWNALAAREAQLIRPPLHVMTTDPRGLVLDVQHEPEFNARVGDGDFDCALSGVVHGLLKVRVLVDVEHAPDLVEVGIPASRAPSSHVFLRPTDEGGGSHAGVCNVNDHLVSVKTSPSGQIVGLRSLTLGEDSEDTTRFPLDMVALAHVIPDKVEAAYLRPDLFDQRRALMSAWAAFVTPTPMGTVVRGLA